MRTPEPENLHLKIPFPLIVADVAAAFIPEVHFEEAEVPEEMREQRELIMSALTSLAETPDATLVRVRDGATHVVIEKVDGELRLAVDDSDATVRCSIPLEGIVDALEDWDWETFEPELILDILHATPNGNLLTVEADGARVAINMW